MTPTEQRLETQCWICPKCHDDHAQGGPCTPGSDAPFMPSPDDTSYIAEQYRALAARVARLEAALREIEIDAPMRWSCVAHDALNPSPEKGDDRG
jgi:hypothetical protein